jgi:hypothetical protein
MTQLQKDLSILIPEINKTISNISFPVVKELKEVLWDIIGCFNYLYFYKV